MHGFRAANYPSQIRQPILMLAASHDTIVSTAAIEDLIHELKSEYTIVIVTHNMQQAARVSDDTGFFNLKAAGQPGHLVEFNPTTKMFTNPDEESTEAYISGRFG